jgi:hypothetical protein
MSMTPGLRKFVLAAHVTTTVGWIGAIVVFIALAVVGLTSQDPQTVRGVYLVMEPAAWWVLVPLSFASLLTGVVQSLGTKWGLFRHYWVLFKLAITLYAVVVLVQYMETFSSLAEMASSSDDLDMVRNSSPLGHAVVALLLLLVATALSIYKPRGVTRYEQHKQRALSQRGARRRAAAVPSVLALAGIVGPVLFVVVLLAQDLLRSDYDPLAAATADPMIGPWGWVQQANFVVLGLLLMAFAVGLHRGVWAAGPGVAAPAIVALSGLGLVVAGFFPMTEDASDLVSAIRGVNNAIFAVSVGVGLVVMSWRFVRDVRWRGLADYAAATGVAWFVIARITGAVAESGEAPYGLMRRAMLAIWLSCVVVLALKLRRIAGGGATDGGGRATTASGDRVPAMTGGQTR